MDEPISSAPLPDKRLRFSLLQIVAVMTSVGTAIAIYGVLSLPPLGSSGLAEACLPAVVLVIALWFCRSSLVARLGSYAVVASLLSLLFILSHIARSDWLMGHTQGPPQLIVATGLASVMGVLAGIGWLIIKVKSRQTKPVEASAVSSVRLRPLHWLSNTAIVLLTLFATLFAWLIIPDLIIDWPRTQKKLDAYTKQRQHRAEMFGPSATWRRHDPATERVMQQRPEIPGLIARDVSKLGDADRAIRRQAASRLRAVVRSVRDQSPNAQLFDNPATKATLIRALDDNDVVVRPNVAMAIIELKDQAERQDRLNAIAALGVPQDPANVTEPMVTLLRLLDTDKDEQFRCEAIRSLGRMGPAAGPATATLRVVLQRGGATEQAAAAEALSAIRPAVTGALPSNSSPPPP
jgi:hypothetical protein